MKKIRTGNSFGFSLVELMVAIGIAAVLGASTAIVMQRTSLFKRAAVQGSDFENMAANLQLMLSNSANCTAAFQGMIVSNPAANATYPVPGIAMNGTVLVPPVSGKYGELQVSGINLGLVAPLSVGGVNGATWLGNLSITVQKDAGNIQSMGGHTLTRMFPMLMEVNSSTNRISSCSLSDDVTALDQQLCQTFIQGGNWDPNSLQCQVNVTGCNTANSLIGLDASGTFSCISLNCNSNSGPLYQGGVPPNSMQVLQGLAVGGHYYNNGTNGFVGPSSVLVAPATVLSPPQALGTPVCFVAAGPSTTCTPTVDSSGTAICYPFTPSTTLPCVAAPPAPATTIPGVDSCNNSCSTLSTNYCCTPSKSAWTGNPKCYPVGTTNPSTTTPIAVSCGGAAVPNLQDSCGQGSCTSSACCPNTYPFFPTNPICYSAPGVPIPVTSTATSGSDSCGNPCTTPACTGSNAIRKYPGGGPTLCFPVGSTTAIPPLSCGSTGPGTTGVDSCNNSCTVAACCPVGSPTPSCYDPSTGAMLTAPACGGSSVSGMTSCGAACTLSPPTSCP